MKKEDWVNILKKTQHFFGLSLLISLWVGVSWAPPPHRELRQLCFEQHYLTKKSCKSKLAVYICHMEPFGQKLILSS